MNQSIAIPSRDKIVAFVWQHIMLLLSLTLMTLGVALCVRSQLGSSVISCTPYAFTLAGESGKMPALSLGMYTNILNWLLILGQILVLGKRFQPVQLFQLLIGFVFGFLIDINMALTSSMIPQSLTARAVMQFAGCTVMAIGIAFEMRCASITMPGEGLPAAISKVSGHNFATIKIIIDITLVVAAVISGYIFFGEWLWQAVGAGTLFAMVYVGAVVRMVSPHLAWFDRLLGYRPGFRRYIYGLARFVMRQK